MKVVIDIDENTYHRIISGFANEDDAVLFEGLFKKGAILPKGHGRLIDADDLRCENTDFDTYNDYCIMFDEIDNAPTIIEADKGEQE